MKHTRPKDPAIAARIAEAIEKAGKNPHGIATALGAAATTVYAWTAGTSDPSPVYLRGLAALCGVSADWILTGKAPQAAYEVPTYASREKFLGSNHDLEPADRLFLARLDLGSEDPGAEVWPMLLNIRRQMRRSREAAVAKAPARRG